MCDRGRNDIAWVNENRLTEAEHAGQETALRTAIDAVCEALRNHGSKVAVLLSPKLANEDLLVLYRLFRQVHAVGDLAAGSLQPEVPEDAILRKADPHPNTWMVDKLGLQTDVGDFLKRNQGKALLIFGDDPVGWDGTLADTLKAFPFVAAWMVNRNATAQAVAAAGGWSLPLATHFEYPGSFTNFEGRVQRFEPALAMPDSSLPAYEYAIEMAHTLGTSLWPQQKPEHVLAGIWEQIATEHAGMPPVSWDQVPEIGLHPRWSKTAHPRSVMDSPDPMGSGFGGVVEVHDG